MELVEGTLVEAICPECEDLESSFESLKEPNQNRAICVGCRGSYNIWFPFKTGCCSVCLDTGNIQHTLIDKNNVCFSCFGFDIKDCQQGEPTIELEIIVEES